MIVEAFILSLIVGAIRKGSLKNLEKIPLRCPYLFVLPFIMFGCIMTIALKGGDPVWIPYVKVANIVQYLILLTAIGINLRIKEMWLVGLGTFSNFLVLATNGAIMPVSRKALLIAGIPYALSPQHIRHGELTASTHLKFLADVIPVPLGGRAFSEVVSAGDLLIAVAIFIMIQWYMCTPATEPKEQTAVA